jgi:predicted permease
VDSGKISIFSLLGSKKVSVQNNRFFNNVIYFSYAKDAPRILPFLRDYSVYYIILTLIFILLILNCIWTFFILKMARDILFTDKPYRDSRSDSDDN